MTEERVGDAPFERAECFFGGLAFGEFAFETGAAVERRWRIYAIRDAAPVAAGKSVVVEGGPVTLPVRTVARAASPVTMCRDL